MFLAKFLIRFKKYFFLVFLLSFCIGPAGEYHHMLDESEKKKNIVVWQEETTEPFTELIVAWDGQRTSLGSYMLQLSVYTSEWSDWLDYAFWSSSDQHTFKKELPQSSVFVFQDTLETMNGIKAYGFRVRLEAKEGALLQGIRGLHACVTDRTVHTVLSTLPDNVSVELPVVGLSQIALKDEHCRRICSPTSTTAVIRFLSSSSEPDPLVFAKAVWDSAFDIYGNWVLNTVQASHLLGDRWYCYPARLSSFNQILDRLQKGIPVVVSIKGPLLGGASSYESGHLLVVKGYDCKTKEVLCMDPAFPTDEATSVRYSLESFLVAWSRRYGIAYIFQPMDGGHLGFKSMVFRNKNTAISK